MISNNLYQDDNGDLITQEQLLTEYQELFTTGNTEAQSFIEYLENCTHKNGTLTKI